MALVNKLTAIGDAIRNKNGSTSKLTLDGMVTAINDMSSVTIDGVKVSGSFALTKETSAIIKALTNFPISTENYLRAVVLNNEIHAISVIQHYKYNFSNSSWELVGSNPDQFYGGDAVVYNNKIHYLYGNSHYTYDGTAWTKIKEYTQLYMNYKSAVVFNNEIHCIGVYNTNTRYYNGHYTVDGTSKNYVSTLPITDTDYLDTVVYNNEIHFFLKNLHYKWDGVSWTKVSDLPYSFKTGGAVVYNNKIYLIGGENYETRYYVWDGVSWTSLGALPYYFKLGTAFIFNNSVYTVDSTYQKFYRLFDSYLRGDIND